jgi:hypothetical protein
MVTRRGSAGWGAPEPTIYPGGEELPGDGDAAHELGVEPGAGLPRDPEERPRGGEPLLKGPDRLWYYDDIGGERIVVESKPATGFIHPDGLQPTEYVRSDVAAAAAKTQAFLAERYRAHYGQLGVPLIRLLTTIGQLTETILTADPLIPIPDRVLHARYKMLIEETMKLANNIWKEEVNAPDQVDASPAS